MSPRALYECSEGHLHSGDRLLLGFCSSNKWMIYRVYKRVFWVILRVIFGSSVITWGPVVIDMCVVTATCCCAAVVWSAHAFRYLVESYWIAAAPRTRRYCRAFGLPTPLGISRSLIEPQWRKDTRWARVRYTTTAREDTCICWSLGFCNLNNMWMK